MISAVLVIIALMAVVCDARNVTLSMLPDSVGAKCLDGTNAGYYYQPYTSSEGNKKWIIFLNGGGECDNKNGCLQQAQTALGSSKYFKPEVDANGWFAGSDDCNVNPLFCEWNHVFDPYCSQDLHTGQMTYPSPETWGLQFSGHNILSSILDIMDTHGMKDAEEIVVSGASAGGIGVWTNVDWIAERYPNARVTGLSIAGFYFYADFYTGPNARTWSDEGTMADFRQSAWPTTYDIYNSFVDKDCENYYINILGSRNGGPCLIANQSFPFIQSPIFVVQALSDEVVLQYHDMLPDISLQKFLLPEERSFMGTWSFNMTTALSTALGESKHSVAGIFAAACYIHTTFNNQAPLINGISWRQAFNEYYLDPTEVHVHMDECGERRDGILCNESCPNQ